MAAVQKRLPSGAHQLTNGDIRVIVTAHRTLPNTFFLQLQSLVKHPKYGTAWEYDGATEMVNRAVAEAVWRNVKNHQPEV